MHNQGDNVKISKPPPARVAQLRTVLDSAFDAVISLDLDGRVMIWNDQAERMFDWTKEEMHGSDLMQAIVPCGMIEVYRAQITQCGDETLASGNSEPIEMELHDRSGRCFPVEVSVNSVRIEKGATGYTLFMRDLRPAKERQRKLEVSDERLQRILDRADQGFWDIYPSSEGTALSSRCSTMLGYESGTLANGPPDAAVELHPDDQEHVRRAWLECLQPESNGLEVVYRLKSADGDWRWISDVGEIVACNEDGTAARLVGTRTDVTDRQALEESLLASQKLECLGSVASGFAHDLNNILAAISGHARLAGDVNSVPPRIAESLGVIQLAVTRARVLTENMQALGRSGEVLVSEVGLQNCIESTCALLRPSFPRSIKVTVKSDLALSRRALLDMGQFQQTMINLLLNARDAIENEGSIEVRVVEFENAGLPWARITVVDDGAGISVEDQKHMFKPFFTTKKPGEGTGIGLAVVAALVKSARGRVVVESTVGVGTTMRVELPLVIRENVVESTPDATVGLSGCNVLLVEDHSMLRPMLAEAIATGGHEVSSFERVEGVLDGDMIEHDTVDVCVIDVNLGDGNGVELAGMIEAKLGRPVPTIFSTGNPDSVVMRDLKPWQALLRKPFEIDSLIQMIERLAVMTKTTS